MEKYKLHFKNKTKENISMELLKLKRILRRPAQGSQRQPRPHTSNPRANTSSPGLTQAAQGSLRQGRGHKCQPVLT